MLSAEWMGEPTPPEALALLNLRSRAHKPPIIPRSRCPWHTAGMELLLALIAVGLPLVLLPLLYGRGEGEDAGLSAEA